MLNNDIDLTGQTAIVTGASRGIGEATAWRLANAGANVVLFARSGAAIESIAAAIGPRALAIACDVADWESVSWAMARAIEHFGQIDILINNAGVIDPIARIADADPEGWSRAVDINLKGVFHCTRAVLPVMKRSGGGTIINISSGAATSPLEGWSHYSSTKAAVLMFTRCVHKEEAGNGIRCVGLSPGTVATQLQREIAAAGLNPVSKLAWSDHIPAEWAAEAVVWLTSDAAHVHDGGDFSIKTYVGRAAVGLPPL
ncbi:SDR family oxidoreductase [Novosphingobium sp. LASN5T]|jgi:NAD(P)-dependent dehydrogenase (short-subunit alcohol dehydrogenase family)|uniref:SDR family oxidoreductase n=1 Tax=Novosphingobium sp. LASN5T TaxID=2491021 RepID=UPI000F5DD2B6|nr:SDR family oxidoreductase [Novosphingobium sp. LASN5T]RQW37598.1 SDR family oxidoreductase [Novosphingobium sp. LASN5T]